MLDKKVTVVTSDDTCVELRIKLEFKRNVLLFIGKNTFFLKASFFYSQNLFFGGVIFVYINLSSLPDFINSV